MPRGGAQDRRIASLGLFEIKCMPFGLKGAAQTFQRLMYSVLRDLALVFLYPNDILVAGLSAGEQIAHLKQIFCHIDNHSLRVNMAKGQLPNMSRPLCRMVWGQWLNSVWQKCGCDSHFLAANCKTASKAILTESCWPCTLQPVISALCWKVAPS